jgi:hypothetical protein
VPYTGPTRIYLRLRITLQAKRARLKRKSVANIESPLPVLAIVHPPPLEEGGFTKEGDGFTTVIFTVP